MTKYAGLGVSVDGAPSRKADAELDHGTLTLFDGRKAVAAFTGANVDACGEVLSPHRKWAAFRLLAGPHELVVDGPEVVVRPLLAAFGLAVSVWNSEHEVVARFAGVLVRSDGWLLAGREWRPARGATAAVVTGGSQREVGPGLGAVLFLGAWSILGRRKVDDRRLLLALAAPTWQHRVDGPPGAIVEAQTFAAWLNANAPSAPVVVPESPVPSPWKPRV